ncbi:lipopolysaccharide-induced tumor necrosis factor-alpha factor homolog [Kryptolebias marmoratus]|uniref:lipopolysaccharide-induced tumor necrosis factor-alpha factor homolog n=1 Tax=Kryptolebias marmoratus TaxID=37003 RepID=UPI0007F882CE|nr:lipopolysaccharide-induced tumor necrosis factor-alpha factor homolog [Kryptolebias marmoratus]XP_017269870.1 lipopolysaccharide-induced tumor necrosis factor-alpha factor homolog [Kryptolebias marmoratus]XP_017270044.1 lipopolysaccharide-induced tumor necrosis factor-alpha factor homolog [Kryptolebias marmoratus]XP_024860296.1 lipopolysaccharide-induced tumor necrosis factor-alpha factor homolog [Kryptolebias marmoratus]XP_037830885.1 lipopolysaccharide-induced tumor necrosis factor-alpha f
MEPPSYEEASRHPTINNSFTPGHGNFDSSPSTPPPTYRDAVHPDAFPVLTPPSAVVPPSQHSEVTVHPLTQIGRRGATSNSRQTPSVAVVSQPQPVPIVVTSLIDSPGLVRCPHCRHLITTKVAYKPGWAAWCTCTMLALMGLICGFCLIPLMMRRLQDAHHFCPNCGEKVHIYKR